MIVAFNRGLVDCVWNACVLFGTKTKYVIYSFGHKERFDTNKQVQKFHFTLILVPDCFVCSLGSC